MKQILYYTMVPMILTFILPANTIIGRSKNEKPSYCVSFIVNDSALVVSGIITEKEEIWDRRSNPLMGRPDILLEIRLKLKVISIIEGSLPKNTKNINIVIAENQKLLAQNNLAVGDRGIFYLDSYKNPYRLMNFERIENSNKAENEKNTSSQTDTFQFPEKSMNTLTTDSIITDQQIAKWLENSDNIPGRLIVRSEELKQKALKEISTRYKLKNASVVTMISHQGPCPPPGGYVYWGVCGTINGNWFIWQPGYDDLHPGKELTDPKRYQK